MNTQTQEEKLEEMIELRDWQIQQELKKERAFKLGEAVAEDIVDQLTLDLLETGGFELLWQGLSIVTKEDIKTRWQKIVKKSVDAAAKAEHKKQIEIKKKKYGISRRKKK